MAATLLVVVVLGLAEAALRVLDPTWFERTRSGVVERVNVYSEDYGWRPRPGARVLERGARISVNARGWRGPEIDEARGPAPRLVLLGDSMAFGHGVADERTFAALLAQDGREVVNLGVEGYGPDQALLRFEREGRAFAPDVVALSVCLDNDFADAGLAVFLYDGRYPKPYFTVAGPTLLLHDAHLRLRPWQRAGTWLVEHSQLSGRLAAFGPRPAPVQESWRARRARVEGDPAGAVALVARLTERLRESARGSAARGRTVRFVALLHPNKDSYHRGSPLADALTQRLASSGVALLDLARLWQARGLRFADFAFDATGHLNERGHELVAEALRAWWLSSASGG